jgi:purine-binding chemotaxis protein CheW
MKPSKKNMQCCTFYVNGAFFGVDVLRVREVLRYQRMTPVPLAPDTIEGLINLRGEIVTAIDLRKMVQPTRGFVRKNENPMNVVVRIDSNVVSLLVDEIGDVISIEPENLEEPPNTISESTRKLVDSVYKIKDKLMLILNVDETIQTQAELADK